MEAVVRALLIRGPAARVELERVDDRGRVEAQISRARLDEAGAARGRDGVRRMAQAAESDGGLFDLSGVRPDIALDRLNLAPARRRRAGNAGFSLPEGSTLRANRLNHQLRRGAGADRAHGRLRAVHLG